MKVLETLRTWFSPLGELCCSRDERLSFIQKLERLRARYGDIIQLGFDNDNNFIIWTYDQMIEA